MGHHGGGGLPERTNCLLQFEYRGLQKVSTLNMHAGLSRLDAFADELFG